MHNSSSGFYIGATHRICQDYAIDNFTKNGPYAIISDGCSSSPDSDFGARILVTVQNQRKGINEFLEQLKTVSDALNKPYTCLDATLLAVCKYDYNVALGCAGDGVLVVVHKDGTVRIIDVEYPSGAPLYYSYLLDKKRLQGFTSTFGLQRKVTTKIYSPDKTLLEIKTETKDAHPLESLELTFVFEARDVKLAAVMSDGVKSFFKMVHTDTAKYNEPIDLVDVVFELINIKSFVGDFVGRRLNKFRKDCEAREWKNMDDVSVGAVYVDGDDL